MQPPAGSTAGQPWRFFFGCVNENRNDRAAALNRRSQRRIVGEPQIKAQPEEVRTIVTA
jgi:hypothetical protein